MSSRIYFQLVLTHEQRAALLALINEQLLKGGIDAPPGDLHDVLRLVTYARAVVIEDTR